MKRSIGDTGGGFSAGTSTVTTDVEILGPDSIVWYADGSRQPYRKARVISVGPARSTIADLETGDELEKNHDQIFRADDEYNLPDCAELKCLTYPNVLENLRVRFAAACTDRFKIYTNAGWVLMCVNPYSPTDELYTDEVCEDYFKQPLGSRAPHPFGIASTAFEHLVKECESQYILVTGESGGGKTECSKHLLRYLTWVTSRNRQLRGRQSLTGGRKAGECRLSSLLLASNPILEFFGNARTLRNANSSRFGKLYRLYYNDEGDLLTSARLDTYLLAKSRVVNVPHSEENYHVFHALINNLPSDPAGCSVGQEIFGQDHATFYSPFLGEDSDSDRYSDPSFSFHLDRLIDAFIVFDVDLPTQLRIYRALAGILYMGSVTFVEDFQKNVRCQDRKPIDRALELWEMEGQTSRLLSVLTTIKIRETTKNLDASQARNLLHSLCKGVYENIFHKIIVKLIQDKLSQHQPYGCGPGGGGLTKPTSADRACVGVLDLFGFENLENGFEQLCINYANEELHNHFLEKLIGNEIQLLTSENVVDEAVLQQFSNFQTNPALALFNGKPSIFTHLEEACSLNRSDDEFCRKTNVFLNDQSMAAVVKKRKIPGDPQTFVVHHYAEPVTYRSEGFVQRNMDYLSQDLLEFLGEREHSFIGSMFEPIGNESRSKKITTISQIFQKQMVSLLNTLRKVECYFIKCIKSNASQKPYQIDIWSIDRQLTTGGVSPMLQLMRAGYPCRINYITLHNKFHSLLKTQKAGKSCNILDDLNPSEFAELVFKFLDVSDDEYKIGVSRAFFRFGVYHKIEACLLNVCESATTMRMFCENILKYRREWQCYRVIAAMTCLARLKHRILIKRQRAVWSTLAKNVCEYWHTEWVPRRERRASLVLQKWFLDSGIWRVFYLRKVRALYTIQIWWKDVLLIRYLQQWDVIFERRKAARIVAAVMQGVALRLNRTNELYRSAAVVLQKHARGYLVRKFMVVLTKLQAFLAAIAIQKLFRNFINLPQADRQAFRRVCRNRGKSSSIALQVCSTPLRPSSRATGKSSSPAFGTCRSRRQKTAINNDKFERTIEHWEMETASNLLPQEKIRRRLSVFVGVSATPIVSQSAFRKIVSSARPVISTVDNPEPVTPLRSQKRVIKSTTVISRAHELDERIMQATAERARSRTPPRSRSVKRQLPRSQTEVIEHMGESPRTITPINCPTPCGVRNNAARLSFFGSEGVPGPSTRGTPLRSMISQVPSRESILSGKRNEPSPPDATMSDDGFQSAREHPAAAPAQTQSFSAAIVNKAQAIVSKITRRSISQNSIDPVAVVKTSTQTSNESSENIEPSKRCSEKSKPVTVCDGVSVSKNTRYSFATRDLSPAWLSNPHTLTETVSEESGYMKLCTSKSTDGQHMEEPISRGIATEAIERELEARIGEGDEDEHDSPSSTTSDANMFSCRIGSNKAQAAAWPAPPRAGRLANSQVGGVRRPPPRLTSGGTPAPKSPIRLIDNGLVSEDIPSATGLSWSVLSHTTSSLAKSKNYNGSINHLISHHQNRQAPLPVISDVVLRSPASEDEDVAFGDDEDALSVPRERGSHDVRCQPIIPPRPLGGITVMAQEALLAPPADIDMDDCPARARASLRAWRGVSDETPLLRRQVGMEDERPIVERGGGSNTPLFGDHVSAASHGFSLSAAMSDIENKPRVQTFNRKATPQEKLAIILKHAPSMDFAEDPSGNSIILRLRKDATGIIRLQS